MYATQQLRDEHEGILVMLSVLEHLAWEMKQGHAVHTDHLAQILDFLRSFADTCHHGKEEDLLFPALQAVGLPVDGGPIGVMLADHTEGRGYIRGMVDALERLQQGEDAAHEFVANALGYVQLLRAHIGKENQVLFVLAERMLPPQEHARLSTEFERVEAERIGAGVHERFHEMIHQLSEMYLKQAA
ncbi:MAG: hemerythrin domain-containing protein [Armatimonadota bacterium]